jgi:hypothetical protein
MTISPAVIYKATIPTGMAVAQKGIDLSRALRTLNVGDKVALGRILGLTNQKFSTVFHDSWGALAAEQRNPALTPQRARAIADTYMGATIAGLKAYVQGLFTANPVNHEIVAAQSTIRALAEDYAAYVSALGGTPQVRLAVVAESTG